MKSDLVILSPNQSVGRHSTERHEELLVVLVVLQVSNADKFVAEPGE